MPMLVEHIDAIARKKGHDVVYVTFPECNILQDTPIDYEDCAARKLIIEWLDANHVGYLECGGLANSGFMSYQGNLYLDVPFDEANPEYQKLVSFLENPDGTLRIDGVKFWYLPLEHAMVNKHHDEPGFWDK